MLFFTKYRKNNPNYWLIRFLLVFFPCIEGASRLNEYIRHYEILDYQPGPVHESHLRLKRSLGSSISSLSSPHEDVHLNFKAHNKLFNIRLKRDTSIFSPSLQIDGDTDAPGEADTSHIYSGHLEGVPDSHVFGSIQNGVFDGKIITRDETFYVERAHKYSSLPNSDNSSLHSVIYRSADVQDPFEHARSGHAKGCGITDEVMEWMQNIQNSAVEDLPELKHPKSKPLQKEGPTAEQLTATFNDFHDHDDSESQFAKYSQEYNSPSLQNLTNTARASFAKTAFPGRGRRALKIGHANSKTTCALSIQTDPLLWKHIAEQERTDDETKIREEILSLIAQHVKAVNYIYANTLFDGKEPYKNIRFEVQRIKIDTDKACKPGFGGEKNLFCIENIDVSNFLNLHSLTDHHDFCLAYVFTYRDFTGGTLGLAWVASASGASGGVCETYKTYTETVGGVYQSTRRSLNTGIITFVNYNSRVPPKVSQLTLAHEIGHNFGSPHDYPNKCRPGGTDGNFIMFASATSGDRPNNSKFSECSVKNISSVLDAILHDRKKANCFIETNGTFCGNKIVEDGEECDCGYNYEECLEKCCYPRQLSETDKMQDPNAAGCKRKPRARCSPSEGPCCDAHSCSYVNNRSHLLCKQDTECSLESHCNGLTPQCPNPTPKTELTPCNDGTQVCQGGECRGSICLKFGLQECFLSSNDKSVDKRKLCDLACLDKSGKCRSTSELGLPGLPSGLSLRPGAPCDNFQGYCDVFLKCRAVDAEGPLARLKNLLFNKETLLNIAQWVTEWWWAVLLMGVGFIILMGLFIKCCAVHTPSSNPKKTPARRIGDTLRRPINTLRRHRNANYRAASSNPNAPVPNGAAHPVAAGAPPPPYTAAAAVAAGPSAPRQGPPHGFGEGRGPNRNRANQNRSGSGHGGKPDSRHAQHRV